MWLGIAGYIFHLDAYLFCKITKELGFSRHKPNFKSHDHPRENTRIQSILRLAMLRCSISIKSLKETQEDITLTALRIYRNTQQDRFGSIII